jgi:hypothetical protein
MVICLIPCWRLDDDCPQGDSVLNHFKHGPTALACLTRWESVHGRGLVG